MSKLQLAKNTASDFALVFFHGNAGALDSWGHLADAMVSNLGVEVWIVDYPWHGKSSKGFVKSGEELIAVGEDFLKTVKSKSPSKRVVLHGRSLGSGVASALAKRSNVEGLVLETPYYSTQRLAKEMFPVVPSFILRFRLDNTLIEKVDFKKVLILHGKKDAVIPHEHSSDLKKENPDLVNLISIPEGGAQRFAKQ